MMHERGKSASAIVAVKPTNKAGRPAAEPAERRAVTKGNAGQQNARRAQDRESVSTALGRITRGRKAREEGTVHCALPPYQPPSAPARLLGAQARCGTRGRWADLEGLRGGSRAQAR